MYVINGKLFRLSETPRSKPLALTADGHPGGMR